MVAEGQTPVVGDLGPEPLVPLFPDLADQAGVKVELAVGGDDEVRVDVPDLTSMASHSSNVRSRYEDQEDDHRRLLTFLTK